MVTKKWLLFFLCLVLSPPLFAWDSNGHKLIAEIAYENLSPNAQKTAMQLLQVPPLGYSHSLSFSNSAAWADWIRSDKPQYNALHYINLPYCGNNHCFQKVATPNIVTAILQESIILQNKRSDPGEKGEVLRFYLHWIGDIHQPMHTITYYSADYPQGDAGGNLYRLQDNIFPNLHAFWDGDCGLWRKDQSLSRNQLQALARDWQILYPKSDFTALLADSDPVAWAKASHALAIQYAYEAAPQHYLSAQAQKKAQMICQQQIVLAGYRLAQNLNAWYASP